MSDAHEKVRGADPVVQSMVIEKGDRATLVQMVRSDDGVITIVDIIKVTPLPAYPPAARQRGWGTKEKQ